MIYPRSAYSKFVLSATGCTAFLRILPPSLPPSHHSVRSSSPRRDLWPPRARGRARRGGRLNGAEHNRRPRHGIMVVASMPDMPSRLARAAPARRAALRTSSGERRSSDSTFRPLMAPRRGLGCRPRSGAARAAGHLNLTLHAQVRFAGHGQVELVDVASDTQVRITCQ